MKESRQNVNPDIFKQVDETVELYEGKREIYKLIAEEIEEYFEKQVFPKSRYTFSMVYRIKSSDSLREKLIRHSYVSRFEEPEQVLQIVSDLIGVRIECKFIDDEQYVFELLKEIFSATDDGELFYDPAMPRIRVKIAEEQPQKQKNGFDIYKLDCVFLLGRDYVRFELQIKALVNTFWGEVEHKIVYKNSKYLLGDSFVHDLMTSIKKSLTMIDGQLYVLYKRFNREEEMEGDKTPAVIENFASKIVHDKFAEMMLAQVGFSITFRDTCDSIIGYLMYINKAKDLQDYGKVMLQVFFLLDTLEGEKMRMDLPIALEREAQYESGFESIVYSTVTKLLITDFKWHLFFLILFSLDRRYNADALEGYIDYYKMKILKADTFATVGMLEDGELIKQDVLNAVAERFSEKCKIEYMTDAGIACIVRAIDAALPCAVKHISAGDKWEDIKQDVLKTVVCGMEFK